jgi:hypothetical protein
LSVNGHTTLPLFVDSASEQELCTAFVRFAYSVVDEELRKFPESNCTEIVKKLGFSGLLDQQATQSIVDNQRRVAEPMKLWLGRQQGKFLIILMALMIPQG